MEMPYEELIMKLTQEEVRDVLRGASINKCKPKEYLASSMAEELRQRVAERISNQP